MRCMHLVSPTISRHPDSLAQPREPVCAYAHRKPSFSWIVPTDLACRSTWSHLQTSFPCLADWGCEGEGRGTLGYSPCLSHDRLKVPQVAMDERRLSLLATPQFVVITPPPVPVGGTWLINHGFLGPHCESFFLPQMLLYL